MERVTSWSPSRLARIAGALYLINIICGAFALGYVQSAAPTVTANEVLYRAGIAAHVVVTLTNVPLAMIFYELFRVVSRRAATLIAFFTLVATAIEASSLSNQVSHPIPPAYDVYTVFFAFYAIVIGYLIVTSALLPRAIGALMVLDGVTYLLYGFADMVAPGFASHLVPWTQLPILAGEGSLCLWLLVAGISSEVWAARAAVATSA